MFATKSQYPMLVLMIIAAGAAGYEWFKLMPHESDHVKKIKAAGFGVNHNLPSTSKQDLDIYIKKKHRKAPPIEPK
jgi:hypothetical protein